MIEPIQPLNGPYSIQAVEPTQPVNSIVPTGLSSYNTSKLLYNTNQTYDSDNNKKTEVSIPKDNENKFVQGNEARLQRLKSIYPEKTLKQMGIEQCMTCSQRTYVDVSNDPSVSFKTPTNIPASQSFAAVSAHESEHVANEKFNAIKENGEILYQSVVIHSSICPECGVVYSSGGTTTSVIKKPGRQSVGTGQLVDMKL